MASSEKAEHVIRGMRQVIQYPVAPELREIRAMVHGLNGRMDKVDVRLDKLESAVTCGFEDLHRRLDACKDVQVLKERMARMEGERGLPIPERDAPVGSARLNPSG